MPDTRIPDIIIVSCFSFIARDQKVVNIFALLNRFLCSRENISYDHVPHVVHVFSRELS